MPYLTENLYSASDSPDSNPEQRTRHPNQSQSQQQLSSQPSFHSQYRSDAQHVPNVDLRVTSTRDDALPEQPHHRCLPYACDLFRRCSECGRKQCRIFNFFNISAKCSHPSRMCFSCLLLYICRQALNFRRDMSVSSHPNVLQRRETDPSRSCQHPNNSRNSSGRVPSSSSSVQTSPTPITCPEASCPHVMSGRLARFASSKFCQFVQSGSTDSSLISTSASSSTVSSISTVLQNMFQFDAEVAAIAGLPRVCRACLRTEPDSFFRPLTSHCTHTPRLCTPCIHATLRLHFASTSSHNVRCPWPSCRRIVTPQDISRVYDPLSDARASQEYISRTRHVFSHERLTIALNIADLTIPRATLVEELAVEVAAEYQRRLASAMCNCCHKARRMSEFPFPTGWPCVHALYACQECVAAQIPGSVRKALIETFYFGEVSSHPPPGLVNDVAEHEHHSYDGMVHITSLPTAPSSSVTEFGSEIYDSCSISNRDQMNNRENGKIENTNRATAPHSNENVEHLELCDGPPHIPIVRCLAPKCAAILPFAALASIDLPLARAVASPHPVNPRMTFSSLKSYSNTVPTYSRHVVKFPLPSASEQHSIPSREHCQNLPIPAVLESTVDVIQ